MPFNPFEDVRQPCKTPGCKGKEYRDGFCTVCFSASLRLGRHVTFSDPQLDPVRSSLPAVSVPSRRARPPKLCSIVGCPEKVYDDNLCVGHWEEEYERQEARKAAEKAEAKAEASRLQREAEAKKKEEARHLRQAAKMVCTYPGCGPTTHPTIKGYCRKHYAQWRRAGRPAKWKSWLKLCKVAGCGRKAVAKGFCPKDYYRWRDWDLPPEYGLPENVTDPCKIAGCPRPARLKGYCKRDYNRWVQAGRPADWNPDP